MGVDYSSTSTLHTPTDAFLTTNVDRRQSHKQHSSLPSKKFCTFCKSPNHLTSRCDVVTDTQRRIEVVRKETLCFNCLGHHKISQCQSKYRCKSCKRKHHTTLCDTKTTLKQESPTDKPPESANTTTTGTDTIAALVTPVTPLGNTSTHSLMSPNSTKCLMKTAVAVLTYYLMRAQTVIYFSRASWTIEYMLTGKCYNSNIIIWRDFNSYLIHCNILTLN